MLRFELLSTEFSAMKNIQDNVMGIFILAISLCVVWSMAIGSNIIHQNVAESQTRKCIRNNQDRLIICFTFIISPP